MHVNLLLGCNPPFLQPPLHNLVLRSHQKTETFFFKFPSMEHGTLNFCFSGWNNLEKTTGKCDCAGFLWKWQGSERNSIICGKIKSCLGLYVPVLRTKERKLAMVMKDTINDCHFARQWRCTLLSRTQSYYA
jgi:hypothetical protein